MQSHKTTAKRDSFVRHIFYAQTACLYTSAADGPSQISPHLHNIISNSCMPFLSSPFYNVRIAVTHSRTHEVYSKSNETAIETFFFVFVYIRTTNADRRTFDDSNTVRSVRDPSPSPRWDNMDDSPLPGKNHGVLET